MPDVYPPLANGHPALPYKHPPMPNVHPPLPDRNFHETCHHLKPNRRKQETGTKNKKQTQNTANKRKTRNLDFHIQNYKIAK